MKWLTGTLVLSLVLFGAATCASRAADEKKDKSEPKKVDHRVFDCASITPRRAR